MTIWEMKTHKYLNSVRKQDQLVTALQEEKKRLEQMIYSVGSPGMGERVQTSPVADRTAKRLIQLEEKKAELAAACNAYAEFRLKVTREIYEIPHEKQRMVLYEHYLQFKSMKEIAAEKNTCYENVTKLRKKGIENFWKKNKKFIERQ